MSTAIILLVLLLILPWLLLLKMIRGGWVRKGG